MILLPALDLMDRKPVRLRQGDFDARTNYDPSPAEALAAFRDAGAQMAHVVDLDGTRAKSPVQHDLLMELAPILPLQVAGGIRGTAHAKPLFDAGVARVVVGSLALNEPQAFADMLDHFGPERITLALDVNLRGGVPMVAKHGWAEDSGRALDEVLGQFPTIRHLLVTDIARDGMMQGPNVDLYRTLADTYPDKAVQASGGVACLDDLDALRAAGASAAITGKAIWEGAFTVAEGIARARG
ncbi:HisA/HisF-related TIM barrel protein [Sphingomicrobium astaxanthinifaciens]|uniref:1-(5-phosphoribosyl)-5-[(5- phosphoribosylamino)methylideneamino]imidazole-4- carboxamide isomerase n=1 Tax=Sphingomicrobium astaxanthinifaciens TaxID=1227949 RepID=UPI001FCB41B1|nr:HisA/HisF-related TIM barrel protein [Sphingomicrobium astaxanthinifaciens]MCJ7421210.1 HisA/HisF-related TIM barrel protein [Sphingomicrobium astaxanthinifaciens]